MAYMNHIGLLFLAVTGIVFSSESDKEKRILLNGNTNAIQDIGTLQAEVAQLKQANNALQAKLTTLQGDFIKLQNEVSGSVYTRWGRTSCSGIGTQLVYNGYTGGSFYDESGAAANYVCLTGDPQWSTYRESVDSGARMYGAEYQTDEFISNGDTSFFGKSLYEEDVPCAVCYSSRPVSLMIPGRHDCLPGWTKEYSGYLMAGSRLHKAASEFVCMDASPEVEAGGHVNQNGKLFYFVDAQCGSLKCPPYVQGRELTCVVCSK